MEVAKPSTRSVLVSADDDSQTGTARRQAIALASSLDFSEVRCGQLGIVVTEMARNLALHGGGGEILLSPWRNGADAGMDVLALDTGRGIPDVAEAMEDGFSTGGTPGTGLGALNRLASTLQIYSSPGKGTAVFARVLRSEESSLTEQSSRESAINLPIAGESVCGDAWDSHFEKARSLYVMADGLGHGPVAHEAGEEAVVAFQKSTGKSPKEILQCIHLALTKTRGAAIAIAEILHDRGELRYAGSGNIASVIYSGMQARSLVSMNGTPGHNMGTVQEFVYPWTAGDLLVMHSDGLATRWNLKDYPSLGSRHPGLIAGVLFRDFSRKRDDASILVTGH